MEGSETKFIMERLRDVEARVRALEHHVRGDPGQKCDKCGETASYSVATGRTSPTEHQVSPRDTVLFRCALCGHEEILPA